ncbi:hypothetical protein [Dolichospermum sp. LEGE 00240]
MYQFRVQIVFSGEKVNNLVVGTVHLQYYDNFDDKICKRW